MNNQKSTLIPFVEFLKSNPEITVEDFLSIVCSYLERNSMNKYENRLISATEPFGYNIIIKKFDLTEKEIKEIKENMIKDRFSGPEDNNKEVK